MHKYWNIYCSNYRPISVLAILSKILEHHVHISFYNFLTENDPLSDSQFGFRKSRSCELAVTDLIDRLLNNMDYSPEWTLARRS